MAPPEAKSTSQNQQSATKLFVWLWKDYLRHHKWLLVAAVVLMMVEG